MADPEFHLFLDATRSQIPTEQYVQSVLGGCVRPISHVLDSHDFSLRILCSHVSRAREMNVVLLHKTFGAFELISVPVHSDCFHEPSLHDWLADSRFHTLPVVAIGAPVMFTENYDTLHGVLNGSVGIVQELVFCDTGVLVSIAVQLQSGRVICVSRTSVLNAFLHGAKYYKATFPLVLAFAIPGHLCARSERHGSIYVLLDDGACKFIAIQMLAQASSRQQLTILGSVSAQHFGQDFA